MAAFFVYIYLYTMNINKIFSLFTSNEEPEEQETRIDLSESPIMWIGMFKKMISNYETFVKQMIVFFRTSEPALDMDEVEKTSCHMVHERAFEQLVKLNLNNTTHIDSIKLYSDKTFEKALNSSLNHYLELEEYEKCAFLKKVQDIVNFSQK